MKTRASGWMGWAWVAMLLGTLLLMLQHDRVHAAWVARLSLQGGAAPPIDAQSPTGYALGQRQFLGTHERGETYRWIARTQRMTNSSAFASATYLADNVPVGRPDLTPRLYGFWLAAIARTEQAVTGDPIGIAAERAAVWEPVISHGVAFLAIVIFMWRRFGATVAGGAGLLFALYPVVAGQFLPGVLAPRTWALLFASYALAQHIVPTVANRRAGFGVSAALASSLALWLEPAFGFPVVLISAAVGAGLVLLKEPPIPFLRWSIVGSAVTALAWFVDTPLWSPAAGELRNVHPLYAFAWLGLGLALDACQRARQPNRTRIRWILEIAAAVPLLGTLAYAQIASGDLGWLYPSAAIERLTSLDETRVFHELLGWTAQASAGERFFLLAPVVAALISLALAYRQGAPRSVWLTRSIVAVAVAVLASGRVRWSVVATLVAVPLICANLAGFSAAARRWSCGVAAGFLLALLAWDQNLPASLRRPAAATEPSAADINGLVYRHFAHWLATHNPGQKINALAPPELSDSLVFHGGSRVLMSTAWQSYPGQVAASRFLSAPETTEAEAILQSREITHVILPSWDEVIPLLVHAPLEKDKSTLYSRLQRWIYPAYLRPVPYHLPPVPGYADQKLVVFKVVPAEDEAVSLARLAEYFVEMDRGDPARLVAKVLAESYPYDPNARLARATVFAHAGDRTAFERELDRLAADLATGRTPSSWDRRVQRTIVFALGQRHDLERTELAKCLAECSRELLFTLTPLQAHRLVVLAKRNEQTFAQPATAELAESLGSEYATASSVAARR